MLQRFYPREYVDSTYDIDFEETSSPIAKITTLRAMIVMTTTKGWEL